MVPVPLTRVHIPVPTVGTFPAKVAELLHIDWSAPAVAVVVAAAG